MLLVHLVLAGDPRALTLAVTKLSDVDFMVRSGLGFCELISSKVRPAFFCLSGSDACKV